MPIDFTAIDFETANGSPASPCAVGLVKVRDGKITDTLSFLIQPPIPNDWFHSGNIKVHGIRPSDVDGAPTAQEAIRMMLAFIGVDTLIAHNAPFDMGVLRATASSVALTVGSGVASGVFRATKAAVANSNNLGVATGGLRGTAAMVGIAPGTCSVSGVLRATGAMVGNAAGAGVACRCRARCTGWIAWRCGRMRRCCSARARRPRTRPGPSA